MAKAFKFTFVVRCARKTFMFVWMCWTTLTSTRYRSPSFWNSSTGQVRLFRDTEKYRCFWRGAQDGSLKPKNKLYKNISLFSRVHVWGVRYVRFQQLSIFLANFVVLISCVSLKYSTLVLNIHACYSLHLTLHCTLFMLDRVLLRSFISSSSSYSYKNTFALFINGLLY